MRNKETHNVSSKRRDFLKKGLGSLCTAGITYATIDSSRAQEFGLSVGESNFIEVVVSYETRRDLSLGNSDGLPRYFLDQDNNILGLVNSPEIRRFIQEDTVVTDGRIVTGISPNSEDTSVLYQGSTSVINIGDVKYNRTNERGLFLQNPIQQPTVEIASEMENAIRCSVENEEFTIRSEKEREITLQSRTTEISAGKIREPRAELKSEIANAERPTETIDVTPKVKIRNNGVVTAFGAAGNYVIPPNTEDPMAKNMIAARREAPNAERIQTSNIESKQVNNPKLDSSNQLFVIQREDEK